MSVKHVRICVLSVRTATRRLFATEGERVCEKLGAFS